MNESFKLIKKHSAAAERSDNIGKVFWSNIEDNYNGGAGSGTTTAGS